MGAEFIGTAMLLATVIGSGIMGERLAGGNVAIALLGNTIPTGAILVVLITMLGPISGAHFNPAVTAVFAIRGEKPGSEASATLSRKFLALSSASSSPTRCSTKPFCRCRRKCGPGLAMVLRVVATFGLVLTILLTLRANAAAVATSVGLYITAAYWFTASTSFANPAVTIARAFPIPSPASVRRT